MQLPFPPPPGPIDVGPVEQVFAFSIAYLLLLSLVLLALPQKWLRQIVRVAFHFSDG